MEMPTALMLITLQKKKDNQTLCEKQKGNQTFRGNQNKVGIKGVCQ
jgi:hypothetical protein